MRMGLMRLHLKLVGSVIPIRVKGSRWIDAGIPFSPPRVDSSKGPHRVNRAHWPTKENRQNINISFFFLFFRSMEKMASDGPKYGPEDFFLLIQTSPTFGAEWI